MKTLKYLLIPIAFLLTSCYIYKPYVEKDESEIAKQSQSQEPLVKSLRMDNSSNGAMNKTTKDKGEAQREKIEQKGQQNNGQFTSADGSVKNTTAESKGNKPQSDADPVNEAPKEIGLKGKLQPNKYYKITAAGNQYKIQVDKWEGDTLVSHKIRKPGKIYKHHINEIEEETLLERRFSKPFSDLLTVGAYASGAAIVLLLIL